MNVAALVLEAARSRPGRPALRAGGQALSYDELAGVMTRVARALVREGVHPGRRVGLLAQGGMAVPLVVHGALAAGASLVPLSGADAPHQVAEALEDAGADVVLGDASLQGLVPPGVRFLPVNRLLHGPEVTVPAGVLPNGGSPAAVSPDAEALVVYGASADGRARGARLSHRNLVANARGVAEALALSPSDRVLAMLPANDLFGLALGVNAPLSRGALVLLADRPDPLGWLELAHAEGATVVVGTPSGFRALLGAAEDRPEVRLPPLRVAISCGALLDEGLQAAFEARFGVPLRQAYGLAPCGPVCLVNHMDRPFRRGTLGAPLPGVHATVRDADGEILPDGAVGELCIAGPNVFLGYTGDEGRNPAEFFGDAFRTGDLAEVEPDGAIRWRGTLRPRFVRGGHVIYPREIERAVAADPRVARVEARGIPQPTLEEEIEIVVTPAPGAILEESDVREICRQSLAAHQQPGRIVIDAQAPRARQD